MMGGSAWWPFSSFLAEAQNVNEVVVVRDDECHSESFGSMDVTGANAPVWVIGQMKATTETAASVMLRQLVLLIR